MRPVYTAPTTTDAPVGQTALEGNLGDRDPHHMDTPTISVEYDQADGDSTHVQLISCI